MGTAIIIKNANFAEMQLGNINPVGIKIPVKAFSIKGNNLVEQIAFYSVEYNPVNTTEKDVVWSIIDGAEYATIDQSGKLTVLEGANGNLVTIKATSAYNSSVYATKEIEVTYEVTHVNQLILDWEYGFWDPNGQYRGLSSSEGAEKRYVSTSQLTEIFSGLSLKMAPGFVVRLIVATSANGSNMVRASDLMTNIEDIYETAKSLSSSATHFTLNVCHEDVITPASGTAITETELTEMNTLAVISR